MRANFQRVSNGFVTTSQGNIATEKVDGDGFDRAWREMRDNGDIQFSEIIIPEREPQSNWLSELLEWLGGVFEPVVRLLIASWPVLQWVLIITFAGLVLYYLYDAYGPGFDRRKSDDGAERSDWVPEQSEAMALLDEADRLAEAGNFDAATHLLLQRSVGQIAEARPDLVEPSSTARELASEPRIPEAARNAFGKIAEPVERNLFALRTLERGDWQAARDAYADFALAQKAIAA